MKQIRYFLLEIFVIGVIAFLITNFLLQICFVKGNSMEPTYKHGTMLFAKKYDLNIKNNDVVIIKKDNKIIIKRVIGLPGNSIIIKDGYIFVNDEKHDDFFIEDPGNVINEIILQDDEYYVLGDNRQESIDSRFEEIGIIKKYEIKGIII